MPSPFTYDLLFSSALGISASVGQTITEDCLSGSNSDICNVSSVDVDTPLESIEYSPEDVLEAQKLLKKLGYRTLQPDGIFGPQTKKAIAQFQFDHGYSINEEVSLLLLYRLKLKIAEQQTN